MKTILEQAEIKIIQVKDVTLTLDDIKFLTSGVKTSEDQFDGIVDKLLEANCKLLMLRAEEDKNVSFEIFLLYFYVEKLLKSSWKIKFNVGNYVIISLQKKKIIYPKYDTHFYHYAFLSFDIERGFFCKQWILENYYKLSERNTRRDWGIWLENKKSKNSG